LQREIYSYKNIEINKEEKPMNIKATVAKNDMSASDLISDQISRLSDWRGDVLAWLRRLILEASPGITEEWKWGTAVWSKAGMVCSAGAFKDHVKLNFFKGASLEDPKSLFNAGRDAKASRSIDFGSGDSIDESALKDLIRSAVIQNLSGDKKK
jgi:hypothetical protein